MDVRVSIKCRDCTIRVKLVDLLKYPFFRTQLTAMETQMAHERKTVIGSNGSEHNLDIYIIPELTVTCKSNILLELIEQVRKSIFLDQYDEDLLEYIQYNQMYEFNHLIESHCWGNADTEKRFYGLLTYIKQKLPHFNVYMFLKNCDLELGLLKYSVKICPLGELDSILIPDMLEYIELVMLQNYYPTYLYEINSIVDALHCLVYCYNIGFMEKVKEKINSMTIKRILQDYKQKSEKFYTEYRHRGYSGFFSNFNYMIDKIFNELHELAKLGLINMTEIGSMETYKIEEIKN
jgi:hypothetical protein